MIGAIDPGSDDDSDSLSDEEAIPIQSESTKVTPYQPEGNLRIPKILKFIGSEELEKALNNLLKLKSEDVKKFAESAQNETIEEVLNFN